MDTWLDAGVKSWLRGHGQSIPGKETQCKGVEVTYIEPSVCYCTVVLRTKTLSQTKLSQSCPQFPFSIRFTSFHGSAYEATTLVSPAAIVMFCHMHVLKEMKEEMYPPNENMGINVVIVEVIIGGRKEEVCFCFCFSFLFLFRFVFFLKLWLPFDSSSPCQWLCTFQFSSSWIFDLIMVMIMVTCWPAAQAK